MSPVQTRAHHGPSAGWPVITTETLPWTTGAACGAMTRRDQTAQRDHYEAAISPAIAALDYAPSQQVAAAAGDAATEMARFDAELGAEIAPFSAILLRSESTASSNIEQLTASARSVALAELGDTSKVNASLIAANTAAMKSAVALADKLDAYSILQIHRTLMENVDPGEAGKWRTQQVWVGGSSFGPSGATCVAPHHDRVPAAIDDLIAYMNRDDIPVLIQAAIAHAQFETIHPFTDGNGRTGRALIHALLRGKGLTRNVTVPVSAGLLADTDTYFDALTTYREGDPEPIILAAANASFRAIANARQLVDDLRRVRESWRERIRARSHSATWEVADLLMQQPVVNAKILNEQLGIGPTHVRRHMDVLVAAGVVQLTKVRQRGVFWRAQEVLDVLDAFATNAGKRTRAH
jgi:Fic family protein